MADAPASEAADFLARAGITDDDFDDAEQIGDGTLFEEAPAEAAPEAPATSDGPARDEMGRFAPKAETPAEPVAAPVVDEFAEPPSRFSPDARAVFKDVPLAVRAELHRAFKEMEGGLNEHQARWGQIKQYDEMARASGTTLAEALNRYTGIERQLAANPVQGIDAILRNFGTDVRSFAAQVMGQPAPERDQVIEGLRAELAAVKQQVGTVQTTFQEQRAQQTQQFVNDFWSSHPRADALSNEQLEYNIPDLVKRGYPLEKAYEIADRLNPAPPPPAPPQPQTLPEASLSLTGAPSAGSDPSPRTPRSTSDILRSVGI